MKVLLISTYELGRQPFGLASPAAWLSDAGAEVTCCDLAVSLLDEEAARTADLIGIYVPMHTATRLSMDLLPSLRALNPTAHISCYGLYAPINADILRQLGASTILGGEFEDGLLSLYQRLENGGNGEQTEPLVSLERQRFRTPERRGLPALKKYARLHIPDAGLRTVGYTEASRGCKHHCRHCPIVPVYKGRFRIVQREVVLADIANQVSAGADHITFGDPDFFNGPGHARAIVEDLHREWPDLTYDVTIKVEHLLAHRDLLPVLKETGCLFVISAVESIDPNILRIFDKGHTKEGFQTAAREFRELGLNLSPTFVTFTPWTTVEGYVELLQVIRESGLIGNVSPIQYAIRLLITAGSRLLELPETQEIIEDFDPASLVYPWTHPDPRVDQLHSDVLSLIEQDGVQENRSEVFRQVWNLATALLDDETRVQKGVCDLLQPPPIQETPYLTEPWYC